MKIKLWSVFLFLYKIMPQCKSVFRVVNKKCKFLILFKHESRK